MFYVFSDEPSANGAADKIVENVRAWALRYAPDALADDGRRLRGRNAATGELVNVYTERWAVPQQIADGRWVFLKPTQDKTTPIPVDVFLAGIDASEAAYDPAWFSS